MRAPHGPLIGTRAAAGAGRESVIKEYRNGDGGAGPLMNAGATTATGAGQRLWNTAVATARMER